MASLAIYLTAIYLLLSPLLTFCTAELNWREEQCKLLPEGNDLSKEFQQKASEIGVELVYLNLEFVNYSFNPLEGRADLFLPDRWVYARSVGNPMLSLSYDYDVLSWSLLNYQVRSIAVPFKDYPSGCLAQLNSSALLTRAIGKALLNVTSFDEMPNDAHAVCVSVIDDWGASCWDELKRYFKSNVEYRCCVKGKESGEIRCEQSVESPKWLQAFTINLDILTVVMILFCAAFPLLLPDCIVSLEGEIVKEKRRKRQEQREQENDQGDGVMANDQTVPPDRSEYESLNQRLVYFDDESPITCSILLEKCISRLNTKGLTTKLSYNIKLIIGYFFVIPFFFFINLLIGSTVKHRYFDEASKKENAVLDGFQHFYFTVFRLKTTGDIVEMLAVTLLPFLSFVFASPEANFLNQPGQPIFKCFICKETSTTLGEDMQIHIKKLRFKLYHYAIESMNLYCKIITGVVRCGAGRCEKQIRPPCRKCKRALLAMLWILPFYAFILICCLFLGAVGLCIFLGVSIALILWYSPLVCLQYYISLISARIFQLCVGPEFFVISAVIVFPFTILGMWISLRSFILMSLTPAYLLVSLSCRFIIRMLGLTVMGLVLNQKIGGPFLSFIFVAIGNVLVCWRNFQKAYKEVKDMISKYWIRHPRTVRKGLGGKYAFPDTLFWHICGVNAINGHNVLPITSEFYRMLGQIAGILIFLFLILCTVVSFGHAHDITAWAPTVYMFVSGVIASYFFKSITKGKRFSGERKREIMKTIKRAVDDYVKVLQRQTLPNGNAVDFFEIVIGQ